MHPHGSKRPLAINAHPSVEKRKIRKGTLSCWECKRRKVRCSFTVATDPICDGCKGRKTTCISQEFPEHSANEHHDRPLCEDDRIGRLEVVVDRLVKRIESIDRPENDLGSVLSTRTDLRKGPELLPVSFQRLEPTIQHDEAPIPAASTIDSSDVTRGSRNGVKLDDISHMLFTAWPCQHDLDIILHLPAETSALFHGTIFAPFSTSTRLEAPSIRRVMRLPPVDSHPVLTARKLLILATYLQSLSPAWVRVLEDANVSCRELMSSMFENVHSCVICQDELLESIEGIECVMIASMYQNNAGNLRAAWQSVQRAILVAQLMGLHQGQRSRPPKLLEAETENRVCPQHLWFRLVQMNRYLSLMMGLPQGTLNNNFAEPQVLEKCSPVDRMQRMDCAAGGYILQRNEAGLFDMATTRMIDQMLQQSEAALPISWWAIPDLESNTGKEMESLERILRAMDQLTHYHLVTQLHLPHLVHSYIDHEFDYSKIMAINASREVLMRFTSLRHSHSFLSFCRGISLLAFIACTTVCVVHIRAKLECQKAAPNSDAFLELLMNQHQRDRSLMDLTLEGMEGMAQQERDPIASKTAPILSHLLSVEAGIALHGNGIANPVIGEDERGFGCGGKVGDSGEGVQIHIPYIGTLNFKQIDGFETSFMSLPPPVDKLAPATPPEARSLVSSFF